MDNNSNTRITDIKIRVPQALTRAHSGRADDYDKVSCLPRWAQQSLREHEADTRPHLYSAQQMEQVRWSLVQHQAPPSPPPPPPLSNTLLPRSRKGFLRVATVGLGFRPGSVGLGFRPGSARPEIAPNGHQGKTHDVFWNAAQVSRRNVPRLRVRSEASDACGLLFKGFSFMRASL